MNVTEHEVEVPTSAGTADAVYFESGERPGIIFLPDGFGSRPSQRDMARRIAEQGYNVLLPNTYYRVARPPFFEPKPDFNDEKVKARFRELTGALDPTAMQEDASAYVDFLTKQQGVGDRPLGVVGFCFTGKFALRAAAARPDRICAAASFHGGGLYIDDRTSPHHELPEVTAQLYFGHAKDDRGMPPEAIEKFEEALDRWNGDYESEIYNARHGWTVPDSAAYDKPEAERAFGKLMQLFEAALGVPSGTPQ